MDGFNLITVELLYSQLSLGCEEKALDHFSDQIFFIYHLS